jgi:hypothetical protein
LQCSLPHFNKTGRESELTQSNWEAFGDMAEKLRSFYDLGRNFSVIGYLDELGVE